MLEAREQAHGRHHYDQADKEMIGRAEGRPQWINRQWRAMLTDIGLALEEALAAGDCRDRYEAPKGQARKHVRSILAGRRAEQHSREDRAEDNRHRDWLQ